MDAKTGSQKPKRKNADADVINTGTDAAVTRKTRSSAKNGDAPVQKEPVARRGKKTPASDNTNSVDDKASGKPSRKKTKTDNTDASASSSGDSSAVNDTASKSSSKESHKTVTLKGAAPIDSFCPVKDTVHVFSEGDTVYDVMLNQTAVQKNNNKYYVIQLLEADSVKGYSVWQRWGRVGYDGQNKLDQFGAALDSAKKAFCKKFHDKTGNDWDDRCSFVKRSGKYDLVEIDYTSKDEPPAESTEPKKPKEPPASKLHQSVQDLLKLICDIRAMENAVKEMKYDASKAPLGKLTPAQIKAGFAALKEVEACVESGDLGQKLIDACNEFYTRIPHYFGMKTPPLISSREEIKQKLQLLEALSDIEVAIRTLAASDEGEDVNPVDKHYHSMKCSLTPLDHDSDEFTLLNEYLTKTHGQTHTMYNMELLNAYECVKDGEDDKFKDVGNRMLLWHGSRLTNWYGILSQGLRIAPPEAPVTGYMFGKGVYFADMCSKSANYCFTTRERNVGLLVLCEVALGKSRELFNADYKANELPSGYHSTKGIGRTIPDEASFKTLDNGCVVPCGLPVDSSDRQAALQYNEYIVYDTSQIKMKYLLQVKFVY